MPARGDGEHRAEPRPDERRWRRAVAPGEVVEAHRRSSIDRAKRFRELRRCVAGQPRDRRQEAPLVRPWLEGRLDRGTAWCACRTLALQRQGDQVPEASLGQEVLGGEEPVVTAEVKLDSRRHGLAQQGRSEGPGATRRDEAVEEHPHVAAVARAGSFQCCGHPVGLACVEVGECVQGPRFLVEVTHQQRAGVTAQQRVDADRRATLQVCPESIVGQRQVVLPGASACPPAPRRR